MPFACESKGLQLRQTLRWVVSFCPHTTCVIHNYTWQFRSADPVSYEQLFCTDSFPSECIPMKLRIAKEGWQSKMFWVCKLIAHMGHAPGYHVCQGIPGLSDMDDSCYVAKAACSCSIKIAKPMLASSNSH